MKKLKPSSRLRAAIADVDAELDLTEVRQAARVLDEISLRAVIGGNSLQMIDEPGAARGKSDAG